MDFWQFIVNWPINSKEQHFYHPQNEYYFLLNKGLFRPIHTEHQRDTDPDVPCEHNLKELLQYITPVRFYPSTLM